jgi:hypothetical protein
MVLISGVGAIVYRYSVNYMFQDRGYRRFLALIVFTTFVLLCMVSSINLVMLFVFWQLLSYLLALLAHNLGHAATLDGHSERLRSCASAMSPFSRASFWRMHYTERSSFTSSLPEPPRHRSRCHLFLESR